MPSNATRRPGWHRGGAWPGWLRWWYDQGGPQRDAQIYDLYTLSALTQSQVAALVGCSQMTVSRALRRAQQRQSGGWPPYPSNGFGMSFAQRRALGHGWLNGPKLTQSEREFEAPGEVELHDQEHDDR